jgi:hypothetical protein
MTAMTEQQLRRAVDKFAGAGQLAEDSLDTITSSGLYLKCYSNNVMLPFYIIA